MHYSPLPQGMARKIVHSEICFNFSYDVFITSSSDDVFAEMCVLLLYSKRAVLCLLWGGQNIAIEVAMYPTIRESMWSCLTVSISCQLPDISPKPYSPNSGALRGRLTLAAAVLLFLLPQISS